MVNGAALTERRNRMKYPWIDAYLLAKRGVTKDLQADWNWIRYKIGGRMFAAVLLDKQNQPYYINLKLDPLEGEWVRQRYSDVIPGYYSNKLHWNSVKADGTVPDDLLKEWLDKSYRLVLASLSCTKQRMSIGLTVCGTDCSVCLLYGNRCTGCNEVSGKVFHAPSGKPCPIFACCTNKNHLATCACCNQLPCAVWKAARDPSMTEEQFNKSMEDRVDALKHFG